MSDVLSVSREGSLMDFLKECDLEAKQTGRALFMVRSRFTRDMFRKDRSSALVLKRGCSRGPATAGSHKRFCSSITTKLLHDPSVAPLEFLYLRQGASVTVLFQSLVKVHSWDSLKECDR